MTIANLNIKLNDEDISNFVAEHVSREIETEEIKINKDKRKATVTITRMLTPQII